MELLRYDRVMPTKERRRAFDCGNHTLNRWLAEQAGQSLRSRDAVTYLLMDADVIAGYYCMSAGSVARTQAASGLAARAPDPVPMIRIGRFAIDREYQGAGWGADLLREALVSALTGSQAIGARGVLVDAIDEKARAFYLAHGFVESPVSPMLMMIDFRSVAASLPDDPR